LEAAAGGSGGRTAVIIFIAEAIRSPGGEQAVQLKVAEKAVEAYAHLAQKNNTMIVPGNMTEVSALIGTAMALMKSPAPPPVAR